MNKDVKHLKTPFYIIDEKELCNNLNSMKEALNHNFSSWIIGYSFKTNSLPWILSFMKENDCFAEVVSFDEYSLALNVGFQKDKIIYNGPMKDKETFLEAIQNGCIVNIDTWREIEWLQELDKKETYKIGIRVNFDIEQLCPGESACGDEGGRFGFCYENNEFDRVLSKINEIKNVRVAGIHLHTSSKTRSVNIYKAIANTAVQVIEDYHLELDYVDVGGGFFGGMPSKPSFNEYFSEIKNILNRINYTLTVIVEPGASLIASPISFHTSVIDVKITNKNIFITTDGSRNDIDPLMSKSNYLYSIERKKNQDNRIMEKQVVSGFTCMEHDRLFELRECAELHQGDRIVYHKVGSYTMCLSPLFIKYFPDVYVKKNNDDIIMVREKWEAKEYVQKGITK